MTNKKYNHQINNCILAEQQENKQRTDTKCSKGLHKEQQRKNMVTEHFKYNNIIFMNCRI